MRCDSIAETAKLYATLIGIVFACVGLFVNAFATFKNIRSRKLLNYQEIIKSHREIWKLALEKPDVYGRILAAEVDLHSHPLTVAEKRFVNLLLLHSSSAFYFAKSSDIVKIEQLRFDLRETLALPVPRAVWNDQARYFNKDFVDFVDGTRGLLQRFADRVCRILAPTRDANGGLAKASANDRIVLRATPAPQADGDRTGSATTQPDLSVCSLPVEASAALALAVTADESPADSPSESTLRKGKRESG